MNEKAKKEGKMKKILETGMSTEYVKDWTVTHALREIIQNWIDVRNQYKVSGHVAWKAGMVTVKDQGPGMELRHLAIGISEKAEGSIGQFGEGLKLAFLVLAREGRKVELWTKGQVICPKIAFSEGYGTDVLQFEVRPMKACYAARYIGTGIKVECTKAELEAGKDYFTCFRSRRKGFTWVEKGKISSPGGQVFVNGSAVGKLPNAIYSYHLSPDTRMAKDLLNRDRDTVEMSTLMNLVGLVLIRTSSQIAMRTLLQEVMEGHFPWESTISMPARLVWGTPRIRVWKRAWNQVAVQSEVLSCGRDIDHQAEYRGHRVLKNVPWGWRALLEEFVPKSSDVVSSVRPAVGHIAQKNLDVHELANLQWARKMIRKYYHNPGLISIVTNLDAMAGMAPGSMANGAHNPKRNRTYINRSILSSRKETLHVLLHETVHKVSGAADLTVQFEKALLDVAVQMMAEKTF